jgi:hypothetical protein
MSWDVFSSAPVIVRPSSFPTLVPTKPLFDIITNSPTEKPSTNIKTQTQIQSPTERPIRLTTTNPTLIPTLNPTVIPSTLIPTLNPTVMPSTLIPTTSYPITSLPTISTNSVNSVNTNKNDSGNQTNTTSVIIAVVVVFVVMLVLIAFLCFSKKKEKRDPYQVWTNFYEMKQIRESENLPTDIHHFYNKSTPSSTHEKPPFVPYVSTRPSIRKK